MDNVAFCSVFSEGKVNNGRLQHNQQTHFQFTAHPAIPSYHQDKLTLLFLLNHSHLHCFLAMANELLRK